MTDAPPIVASGDTPYSGVRLTDRQRHVLREIAHLTHFDYYGARGKGAFTPLDLGSSNGSHHSATLGALVRKGLVEHRKGMKWGEASTRVRGSKVYRASAAGIALWQQLWPDERDYRSPPVVASDAAPTVRKTHILRSTTTWCGLYKNANVAQPATYATCKKCLSSHKRWNRKY